MASQNKTPNLDLPQWQANEQLERADLNNAFDNIDTAHAEHLAESSARHIHSSGDGWIRYDDGTQEVWGTVSESISTQSSGIDGGGFRTQGVTISFSPSFLAATVPVVTATLSSVNNSIGVSVSSISSSNFVLTWRTVEQDSARTRSAQYRAIGRWK